MHKIKCKNKKCNKTMFLTHKDNSDKFETTIDDKKAILSHKCYRCGEVTGIIFQTNNKVNNI